MELECAKYGETMEAEQAACRHPGDYCQHRKSCMIQFMERENKEKKQRCNSNGETYLTGVFSGIAEKSIRST